MFCTFRNLVDQLQRLKRLSHIIISPDHQSIDFINILLLRCQHDNGPCVVLTNGPTNAKAIHIRKHDIQYGQIVGTCPYILQSLCPCIAYIHLIIFIFLNKFPQARQFPFHHPLPVYSCPFLLYFICQSYCLRYPCMMLSAILHTHYTRAYGKTSLHFT